MQWWQCRRCCCCCHLVCLGGSVVQRNTAELNAPWPDKCRNSVDLPRNSIVVFVFLHNKPPRITQPPPPLLSVPFPSLRCPLLFPKTENTGFPFGQYFRFRQGLLVQLNKGATLQIRIAMQHYKDTIYLLPGCLDQYVQITTSTT